MVMRTDCPDMTIAVDSGHKESNPLPKKKKKKKKIARIQIFAINRLNLSSTIIV